MVLLRRYGFSLLERSKLALLIGGEVKGLALLWGVSPVCRSITRRFAAGSRCKTEMTIAPERLINQTYIGAGPSSGVPGHKVVADVETKGLVLSAGAASAARQLCRMLGSWGAW